MAKNKFKRFSVSIQIDTIEKAKFYYRIFNTPTDILMSEPEYTDSAIFVKIKKKLEKQGIDVGGW